MDIIYVSPLSPQLPVGKVEQGALVAAVQLCAVGEAGGVEVGVALASRAASRVHVAHDGVRLKVEEEEEEEERGVGFVANEELFIQRLELISNEYRVSHQLADLSLVDFYVGSSAICQILLRQRGFRQIGLSNWARRGIYHKSTVWGVRSWKGFS